MKKNVIYYRPVLNIGFFPLHKWYLIPFYHDCSRVYNLGWLFFDITFYWDI